MASGFLHGISRKSLTADQVEQAVGLVPLTGCGDVEVIGGRGGAAIGVADPPVRITDIRPIVVTNKGPAGEDDFDDERYWTQAWRPAGGKRSDSVAIQPDRASYPDDWWVPATNLAEWKDGGGTHDLATDGTVLALVLRIVDQQDNERFVFTFGGGTPVRFGKLSASWPAHADHNIIDLTRCVSASDDTALLDSTGTPLPDVQAYIQTPIGSTPAFFAANSGDVVDYYTDPDGNNVLLHAPVPGSNSLYDVVQITSVVGGLGVGGCGPLRAQ